MNPNNRLVLFCLLIFALTLCEACRATSTSASEVSEADGGFRALMGGYQSAIGKRGVRIARDESEWQALWKEHSALVIPRPDAPAVDWSRDMVLGAFLGERGTAGYGIEVRRVRADDGQIVVEAIETRPAADRIVPQVVTRPYQFVVLPRTSGEGVLELR